MEIPKQGLALYTWGNASEYDPALGVFAIKPSGIAYAALKPEDLVIVDLDAKVVEGSFRPSSDTKTHAVLYARFADSGIQGIVHTHSPHAVAWAQACRSIPLLGTTHADHLCSEIPCTAYLSKEALEADYEQETGKLICSHFEDNKLNPSQIPMVLVAGHGPFTWGSSAEKAVYNAAVLEEVARMAWMTLQINPQQDTLPAHIVNKHYLRKHGPSAYYGQ